MRGGIERGKPTPNRRGAAALELVLVLPMFCFVLMAATDYARLFSIWTTLSDCARNGALYASDSSFASSTSYTSIQQAALADASNISPAPTVSNTSGTDSSGNSYVEVTVSTTFTTLTSYPGIPSSVTLTRKLRMVVTPP